ncbi:MAG: exopolygalacturonase [Dysgonamonadaceae bacterium]|jgi:polygalacturonase|nr:exopolygalacturonase [Dysgonamonadaceae bacterium]
MKCKILISVIAVFLIFSASALRAQDVFPDGSPIPEWFRTTEKTDINKLGKAYRITDYGVAAGDSMSVQTEAIQAVIDLAARSGGGVVVVPKGVFLSGSLFFKPATHLHLEAGAVLKGSDDVSNFAVLKTRIEGQSVDYFAALVNADRADGFTISGQGTINGNGLRYWKAFWLRRKWNPQCTNMDEQRPRLVYISNSRDVQISDVRLENSPFWTTHIYKCENVKILGVSIFAPAAPVKAPSSDAIDIDACKNVLVKNCYMSVNDDAIALKGGKGPSADTDPANGENRNIIIEDNVYGFCHSALTCGSESIHNYNIVLRRCKVDRAERLLWLKMRPDTPQNYEFITVEDIGGNAENMLYVRPWLQFFDLKGEKDIKRSSSQKVTMKNISLQCGKVFNVEASQQYSLSDFTFENLDIQAGNAKIDASLIKNFTLKNVLINGNKLF